MRNYKQLVLALFTLATLVSCVARRETVEYEVKPVDVRPVYEVAPVTEEKVIIEHPHHHYHRDEIKERVYIE